jgi:hypothetical protein
MKIFKILHRYADPDVRYGKTFGKLDIVLIEAEDEKDAKKKYGYSGIIAVKEVSIDNIMGESN